MKQIYELAKSAGYVEALQLAREATSEEERNFYTYIADMNLQREQRAYIKNESYEQKAD